MAEMHLKAVSVGKVTEVVTYEICARHYLAARDAMYHFLRGRGWSEGKIAEAVIGRADEISDSGVRL